MHSQLCHTSLRDTYAIKDREPILINSKYAKKLGIKNGDKVLFIEDAGRIYMMTSSMEALREAQMAFKGEAERLGLKNEDDVADMVKKEK